VIGGSTPAAGSFTNITVTGTVDGRDVAADGTKLDTIETNADVTDTANVTDAGALMDSELTDIAAVKALDQGVATTDSPTFVEVTAAQYNSTEALPDIKPSLNLDFANTKALDPRITYTRGSTATYYDGKTFAKAEENLLLYSQEFDNAAWVKLRASVTANADNAPDGTTTADAVLQAATQVSPGFAQQSVSVVAGDYVISVYAKPNGKNFIIFRETLLDGTDNDTWFDVSNGTVGTTNAGHTATISASTNGYYRCSIAFTVNATRSGFARFFLADTDGSLTVADDGNGLYLWGAQLEQRSSLTDYTATTTQPITNYVPALQTAASGEPRFDHDPITGESKGFLIEEQRTNLLTYSEQFDNAAWTKANSSITANTVVAPDGTLTGDKLVEDTANTNHTVRNATGINTGAVTVTTTVYAKAAERTSFRLSHYEAVSIGITGFDLSTGTILGGSSSDDASIVDVGNGWYRCSITNAITTGTNVLTFVTLLSSGVTTPYTGDGYSGIYLWGASLEAGSFPTSYIPTVASQVTRSPDAASMTGTNFSSWYRQDEGSFFSSVERDDIGNAVVWSTSQAGASFGPRHQAVWNTSNLCTYACVADNGSTSVSSLGGSASRVFAIAYKTNDFAAVGGGATPATDTLGNVPVNNAELWLGRYNTGGTVLNGHIKKIAYYPKRLSNATISALTEE
jgi:hypothetical protein